MTRIGPYRVLEPLGRGGMGEVLLAYDDRLDRRVAIKRIRPDAGITPERRERFRREARISARLNHPAVVQIYDVLTEGDVESIVMEYVEGTDLHALLGRGPLDVEQTVRLARQLADGLDAAHRQGIVHRDLKAENVLVTASGQAKITDFGIAKRLLAHASESDESLTQGDTVLGTCRAMSPEQARGAPVDHRTDLFAFGVLLYEALAGISPFKGDNALATLQRVVHHRQPPLREANPAVPESLSALVDSLLEKDPVLRPRSAGQVRRALDEIAQAAAATQATTQETVLGTIQEPDEETLREAALAEAGRAGAPPVRRRLRLAVLLLTLAGLAAAGAYLAMPRTAAPPLYVGVLRPEIGGGNREAEILAVGVRIALLKGLVSLEGISPQGFDEVDAAAGSPQQIARTVSVDEIVRSRLDCRPEACRIALDRLRADGGVRRSVRFEVPTDDLSVAASVVAQNLRQVYGDHRIRRGTAEFAVSGPDLAEYLRLRAALSAHAPLGSVLQGLDTICARAPRFVDACVLEAEVLRRRFLSSRSPDDLRRAFRLIGDARRVAPDDPAPLVTLVDLALDGNQPALAEQTLADLQALNPGDARVLERRSRLLSSQGRPEEALAMLRKAAQLQPSAKRLRYLAENEFKLGHIPEARRDLDLLLQRSPGDISGLTLLASIEMSSGDLNRAFQIFRGLLERSERSPGLVQLSNFGLTCFLLGRYEEAAATFRRILASEPNNPLYTLNLADACFLLGKRAEAEGLYRRVVELIENDPAAAGTQFLTVKAQALAHLGRGPQAVDAVQEALRLAPDQGPVAYEAAVVYALVGEEESALVNVEKALRLGFEPRWFSFPWFDPLRKRPEWQMLLARPRD
jgi:serine/threonine-protein kinase